MNMDESSDNAAYVLHLRTEHQRLDNVARTILNAFVESCEQQQLFNPDNMADAMLRLSQQMSGHFQVEEDGGCLEQAVSLCPNLSAQASQIQAEHQPLLSELDSIAKLTRLAESKEAQDEVHERFQLFVYELQAHEAAENRLLELAFGLTAD